MRPTWCPHKDCIWLTGGGESHDSGCACGGQLPRSQLHLGTPNTHRLCIRTADGNIGDYQTNNSDLWYLGRVIATLRTKALAPNPRNPKVALTPHHWR